jgi:hydrogenase maturation protein HypF
MYLENIPGDREVNASVTDLPLFQEPSGLFTVDWKPLISALLNESVPVAQRAMQFHRSLASSIVAQARRIRASAPFDRVGLTGGVFQNKLLAELALSRLTAAGFESYLPARVPCNDGGIALGQLVEAEFRHG